MGLPTYIINIDEMRPIITEAIKETTFQINLGDITFKDTKLTVNTELLEIAIDVIIKEITTNTTGSVECAKLVSNISDQLKIQNDIIQSYIIDLALKSKYVVESLLSINNLINAISQELNVVGDYGVSGYRMEIAGRDYIKTLEVKFSQDILLQGITFGQTGWYPDGKDFITIEINNIVIFDSIYMKLTGEYKALNKSFPIPKDMIVKISYHNTSISNKIFWIDLHHMVLKEKLSPPVDQIPPPENLPELKEPIKPYFHLYDIYKNKNNLIEDYYIQMDECITLKWEQHDDLFFYKIYDCIFTPYKSLLTEEFHVFNGMNLKVYGTYDITVEITNKEFPYLMLKRNYMLELRRPKIPVKFDFLDNERSKCIITETYRVPNSITIIWEENNDDYTYMFKPVIFLRSPITEDYEWEDNWDDGVVLPPPPDIEEPPVDPDEPVEPPVILPIELEIANGIRFLELGTYTIEVTVKDKLYPENTITKKCVIELFREHVSIDTVPNEWDYGFDLSWKNQNNYDDYLDLDVWAFMFLEQSTLFGYVYFGNREKKLNASNFAILNYDKIRCELTEPEVITVKRNMDASSFKYVQFAVHYYSGKTIINKDRIVRMRIYKNNSSTKVLLKEYLLPLSQMFPHINDPDWIGKTYFIAEIDLHTNNGEGQLIDLLFNKDSIHIAGQ